MGTTRQERINSLIQREIASFILSERFEGITGLITILKVDVTADLEHAKVFFSVVGQDETEVLKILRQHIYEMQGMLYDKLTMRKVPRLALVPDTSGEYAGHISKLIQEIHKKDDDK